MRKLCSKLAAIVLALGLVLVTFPVAVANAATSQVHRLGLTLGANTLTNLLPLLYAALDQVQRELVGFIPACARDSSAERAALNQVINIYISPPAITGDITPGATPPSDGDNVFGNTTMTISKSKYSPIRWQGEEEKQVISTGNWTKIQQDQFAQSMRALVNLVEIDLGTEAYKMSSRSVGTPGAAPFATAADLSDIAGVLRILDDNGTSAVDRHLILGTAAMQNIRGKQSGLFRVNEAGTDELLRQGAIALLEGAAMHTSAGIQTPTKGTGTAYTSTAAGFAIGTVVIPLITGSGTILEGDTVTFAGDTNKYVVSKGGGIAAPGSITINSPGLRQALPASAQALTVGNTAAQNIMLQRPYLQLATRAPAMPEGGDIASDVIEITDPVSGLAFQVARYPQYRQVKFEVGLAWGVRGIKGDGIATLLG